MRQIYKFTNKKGESVEVWLTSTAHDSKNKHDLMNLWLKNGYLDEFIHETLVIETYVTGQDGVCHGYYNPSINYQTHKLCFDWVLENTEENINRILNEIKRMANA